jgi:hypothetical protein
MKKIVLTLIGLLMAAGPTWAQNPWSDKMFKQGDNPPVLGHDFGSVPRGTQLYHRMPIKNIWGIPLQVDARVGCHCVAVSPESQVLQPNQESHLDIRMDAGRFTGPRTVSVYVTLSGNNAFSTSTLRISSNSRIDVVLNPSQVTLGVVPQGRKSPAQDIQVQYAGTLDWRVLGVEDAGPLDVTYHEWYRRPGQVGYRVSVAVKPSAGPGSITRTVYLKTNDPDTPRVPVLIDGMVQATLAAVPNQLVFNNVETGQTVTKRIVVRGPHSFRITGVDGLPAGLQVPIPQDDRPVHILQFTWKPDKPGKLHQVLTVRTDLEEPSSVTVTVDGSAMPQRRAALTK